MVIDIAESLIAPTGEDMTTYTVDTMPPIYPYNARAALKHIHTRTRAEDDSWLRNAENVLQASLDKYFQRWGVRDDWTRGWNGSGKW